MLSLGAALRTIEPGDHVLFVREDETITNQVLMDTINPEGLVYICENPFEKKKKKKKNKKKKRNSKPGPYELGWIQIKKFFNQNTFDFSGLLSEVQEKIEDFQEKECSTIWILNDMNYISEAVPSVEPLFQYESHLQRLCSESPIICICVYDSTLQSSLLLSALYTHPEVYVRGQVCENIYYLPHGQWIDSTRSVESYLDRVLSVHGTQEKVKKVEKKIQKLVQDSDKKYRELIEHVPDAVYSLNNKGKFIEVNTASTQMLGYPREELLGKHFSALIHPSDIKKATESFEELVKSKRDKTIGLELRLLTNTGSIRIGELNARAIYDEHGKFIRTEGIVRDITERKKQEKDIEFLAGVVETVTEAVVITDTDGIITYVNPTAYTMFGYSKKELEGETASILHSNSSANTLSEILLHIQTGDWEGEIFAIKKNGERFPAWVRASALYDEYGKISNAVMVFQDITEQKTAEEKLERYALLLEMKVKKKTQGTETLFKTSYALRNTSNWKEGTDIIMEGIVHGLGFEGAAIYFIEPRDNILECRCQLNFPSHFCEHVFSLTDTHHAAVRVVSEKNPLVIHDTPHSTLTLSSAAGGEVAWIPILFQSEVIGVLAAYTKKEHALEPEDTDILQLYANLIAEFIERTRMVVKPQAENQVSTPSKYNLELHETYVLEEEKPEKVFDIFVDLVKHGFRGFGICRTHPHKVREQYNLEKTPMMWLSEIDTAQVEQVSPRDIPKLIYLVSEFIKRAQPAVVLLEGIEYLIVQNDFNMVLRMLHTLSDYVATSSSVLLLPINPKTLPSHEHFMLRTAFRIID